ncbi:MAG: response regulator [Proteobacteria bacterium]|nr:response regulator [Pseudomonadota bacterium]NOG60788.1 response regulator [Pseudomonadota bacterium]
MEANNITVALIGIPSIEEKRLNAAFLHSQSRHTAYSATELANSPQILMVNADEPASLIEWRKYRNVLEAEEKADPPSVLVSKDREFKTDHYQVRRPLIASRAISILDQVTAKEFTVSEEVAILEQTSEPEVNQKVSNRIIQEENNQTTEVTALVIDDSLPVRIQMDQALRPFTKRVDFAESGEEAFELINTNEYQIIFLDVVLPGMDGYEICKVIKQGKAKDTPIIMLTGNSSPADKIKGKLAGCDTYLIKPVGKAIFKEVVSQYLSSPVNASAM